jgi:hypothetical protein
MASAWARKMVERYWLRNSDAQKDGALGRSCGIHP